MRTLSLLERLMGSRDHLFQGPTFPGAQCSVVPWQVNIYHTRDGKWKAQGLGISWKPRLDLCNAKECNLR